MKKEEILNFFGDQNKPTIQTDIALIRGLLRIYDFQTNDEKTFETTSHKNSVGFTGADGEILTSFGNQLLNKAWLSPKQMKIVRKNMRKYAGQLARHIKNGEIVKDFQIDLATRKFKDNLEKNYYKYQI